MADLDPLTQRLRICSRTVQTEDDRQVKEARAYCPAQQRSMAVKSCVSCEHFYALHVGKQGQLSTLECSPPCNTSVVTATSDGTTISEIMVPSVVCVRPEVSVAAALALFLSRQITVAPVINDAGRPLGVVSKSDLRLAALSDDSSELSRISVGEVMMPIVFALGADAAISQAAALMAAEGVHQIVVLSADNEVVGVLSSREVLGWVAMRDGYLKRPLG